MAYESKGLIEAVDFNNLAWGSDSGGTRINNVPNLAYLHGIGYGRYGYGQDTTGYTQVALGQIVTATQWTSLVGGVNGALSLQGASLISPTTITAGDTITYYSQVAGGITTAWNNAIAGTVGSTAAGTPNTQLGFQGWGGGPERRGRYVFTVSWLNGNLARYWWNMGGKLDITSSLISGGNTRNTDWSQLCAAMGTIRIGYRATTKIGGSGSPEILLSTAGTGGYWMNTTTTGEHQGGSSTHFNQTSPNDPYRADDININVAFSGVSANGGYPTITITVDLKNDYADSPFQETVTNAASVTVTPRNPVVTALGTAPTAPTITSVFFNQ